MKVLSYSPLLVEHESTYGLKNKVKQGLNGDIGFQRVTIESENNEVEHIINGFEQFLKKLTSLFFLLGVPYFIYFLVQAVIFMSLG